jgi:hypothetical protein
MKPERDHLENLSVAELVALARGLQLQLGQKDIVIGKMELANSASESELEKIRQRERAAHQQVRRASRRAARARGK